MVGVCVCVCVCVCGPSFLQSLNVQKSDVDLMRTKLRRLEEENSRKDRQIEQLLDASRVSAGPGRGAGRRRSPGRGGPAHLVFISQSAYNRAQILFGLWQRKGLILAG